LTLGAIACDFLRSLRQEAAARKHIEEGEARKAEGNAALKAGDLPLAVRKYPALEATQGQNDSFFGQLPYKFDPLFIIFI
jgi:hypothetical protein